MDDLELVEALRNRTDEHVRLFLERYRPLLQHCISSFESNPADREDLLQDLVWYVLERLERNSFDPDKGSFGTWLYRVAWCRCVDLKRKQTSRRSLRVTVGAEDLEESVDQAPGPAERLADGEVETLLWEALRELPEEDRILIQLRFVDGVTLAEMGKSLGISLEQTKYRLRRALSEMRGSLLKRFRQREAVE